MGTGIGLHLVRVYTYARREIRVESEPGQKNYLYGLPTERKGAFRG